MKFAILGRIPGTVAGGFLLLWIDQRSLALWLGLSVIVAVGLSLANIMFATHCASHVFGRIPFGIYGDQFLNWRAADGAGTAA